MCGGVQKLAYATLLNDIKENRRPDGHLRAILHNSNPSTIFSGGSLLPRRVELLEQPIKLFAHNAVALAGDSLQALAIYDRDSAARVFD